MEDKIFQGRYVTQCEDVLDTESSKSMKGIVKLRVRAKYMDKIYVFITQMCRAGVW